jgi:hypothetical protein
MGKEKNSKSPKSKRDGNGGDIVDDRFLAATTRPQFSSGRKFKVKKDTDGKRSAKQQAVVNSDDDAEGGNLIANNDGGFGQSLAAAIQSDSRFSEALTNQEKFGCVPLMDKYGRKQKQKKSKKLANLKRSQSPKKKMIPSKAMIWNRVSRTLMLFQGVRSQDQALMMILTKNQIRMTRTTKKITIAMIALRLLTSTVKLEYLIHLTTNFLEAPMKQMQAMMILN